jgi:hypothetical protein
VVLPVACPVAASKGAEALKLKDLSSTELGGATLEVLPLEGKKGFEPMEAWTAKRLDGFSGEGARGRYGRMSLLRALGRRQGGRWGGGRGRVR